MTEDAEDFAEMEDIPVSEPVGSVAMEMLVPVPTVEQVTGQMARFVLQGEGYADRPTLRQMAADKIDAMMEQMVSAKAAAVIEGLLSKPVQKTDGYGNPQGEPISPLSLLTAHIESWAGELVEENSGKTKGQDSYGRSYIPRIQWTMKQVATRELQDAVSKEVERIKGELKAAATQGIARQIAEKVAGMVLK